MAKRIKAIDKQTYKAASLVSTRDVSHVPVEVVKEVPGKVTVLQKVAKYYKGIVAFLGTVAVLLTSPEIGPLQHLLPPTEQHWLTVGIGALTVLLTFLKSNEHWVDDTQVG